jgi:hypothetical protein
VQRHIRPFRPVAAEDEFPWEKTRKKALRSFKIRIANLPRYERQLRNILSNLKYGHGHSVKIDTSASRKRSRKIPPP